MPTIRRANKEHCPIIKALAENVFPHTYAKILSSEQIDYMMQWMYSLESLTRQMDEGHVYFIAFDNATPAGYVSVQQEAPHSFHLQKIYVLPEYQGQGIGRLLLRTAEKFVQQTYNAPWTLRLNVNRNNTALSFYRKEGFDIETQGDFDIGNGYYMNDYIMCKTL